MMAHAELRMPALGHKRTFRGAIVMSALPPKADIRGAKRNVRKVPIADMMRHSGPAANARF